ncbi:cytochrome c oxidase subunit I [Candidatus Poribacteria bacterium]|jgi:cytochrome c oxidase subunit I|nr:cytochrome c oxidase subunit I [Candidatus Poribacteria bacterium]MBT5531474.1 cytochrome c oxidase subunit I [Candidatus Poribacteria bacterium]MBT7099895.1 cytochrome c oxidase subunit I [Candidatus Poribacteria bacterium]MBT7806173.1 cytochrome c oxidase subunit I [Candidatus Poribacteria bacterium]
MEHAIHPEPTTFLRKHVFSVDHKVIGRQYLILGMVWALLGGLMAYVVRSQIAWPAQKVVGASLFIDGAAGPGIVLPETFNALITMHGTVMVFFVAMPILLGAFGNFLVPLMIGARDMAFPRLNMASFWVITTASLVMLVSMFLPGGPAASGWTGYPPLSARESYTGVGLGQAFWILALALEFTSFLMGGVNLLTTAITMRAPGMTMMRLPLMVWMQMTAAVLFMLSVGPTIAGAILLLLDRTAGTSFFVPAADGSGGDPLLWQHLFWFFGHPEVYVILLPGIGVLTEVLPTFSRKPIFSYKTILWSTMVAGVLSFLVWAHHMFVSGMSPLMVMPFSITTILISVPFTLVIFALIGTMIGGSIKLTTPMLFAVGTIACFIVGGVTGMFLGSAAVDTYMHDTYFVVAHFHYTLFPTVILGGLTGFYFWFPKMFGKTLNRPLGHIHFWITVISFNVLFIALFRVGLAGHVRRIWAAVTYDYLKPFQGLNVVATWAAIAMLIGQIPFIANLIWTAFKGEAAPSNPWKSNSLEWQTASPPPHENFHEIPTVHRGAYEYSVPGSEQDWIAQDSEPSSTSAG